MRTSSRWTVVAGGAALAVGLVLVVALGMAMDQPKMLYVKSQAANIRSIPTLEGQILTTVPFGTRLTGVEHIGDWYHVKLEDGRDGYIYEELVTDDHPEKIFVESNMANVRELNNIASPVITTVQGGSELKTLGKKDDWYQVQLADGKIGWIHEELIDDDPPGILFVKVMSAGVHASVSPMSEVVAEVSAGMELKKLVKLEDFYQVQLPDGRSGFIYEKHVTGDAPTKLYVDVPLAEIKTDPTIYGVAKGTVPSGTLLSAYDKEDDFYLVKTPEGLLGWVYDENVIKMTK